MKLLDGVAGNVGQRQVAQFRQDVAHAAFVVLGASLCRVSMRHVVTSKLLWRCANGHEVAMTPNYFVALKNDWCPVCRDDERRRIRVGTRMAALQDCVAKRGGRVTAGEYRDPHSKFTFECASGHVWITTFDSVMRGTWCLQCYRS